MKRWYIAKSNLKRESWLVDSLTSVGVQVYFPKIARMRRGKVSSESLFPTYMFCYLDEESLDKATIRWAPGLSYFLGTNGAPTHIDNGLVDYIRGGVKDWNSQFTNAESQNPRGEPALATERFAILEVMFQKYIDSRRRCRLLLQALGNLSAVNSERNLLSMVSSVL